MPSIPRFHVTQDGTFVYVHVHVPYVRVSAMEFHVEGVHLSFYCKPYLLKLQFPHEVVDDDLAKAVYDPNKENGTIVVHLPKKEPGQHFDDLDLLNKLLQPKKPPIADLKSKSAAATLIEVVASTTTTPDTIAGNASDKQATTSSHGDTTLLELEKRFAAITTAEEASYAVKVTNLSPQYGFNNAYSDVFRGWHGEVSEIVSLPNPDEILAEQRRPLRENAEDGHFDVERYLLDYANRDEDDYYAMAMAYVPLWRQYPVVVQSGESHLATPAKPLITDVAHVPDDNTCASASGRVDRLEPLKLSSASSERERDQTIIDDADRELLLRLPNKEFLIARGSQGEDVLLGGLVDILVGYVYEHLTSQGDSGIESTWTMSIISPTLSWLDTSADLSAIVRSTVRRMLTFPFLRQFDLAMRVLDETVELIRRGKRVVLHSLLDLYRIVEKSETQYLLNTIYTQDYCIWVQSVTDERLLRLAEDLQSSVSGFQKADTGWALDEMEHRLLSQCTDEEEESDADEEESNESSDSDTPSDDENDRERGGDENAAPSAAAKTSIP